MHTHIYIFMYMHMYLYIYIIFIQGPDLPGDPNRKKCQMLHMSPPWRCEKSNPWPSLATKASGKSWEKRRKNIGNT